MGWYMAGARQAPTRPLLQHVRPAAGDQLEPRGQHRDAHGRVLLGPGLSDHLGRGARYVCCVDKPVSNHRTPLAT